MIPASSTSAARRSPSPLWGLWLAFTAAFAACTEGVLSGRIPYFEAVAAIGGLIMAIRLAASALSVPAHPFSLARVRRVAIQLRLARRSVFQTALISGD